MFFTPPNKRNVLLAAIAVIATWSTMPDRVFAQSYSTQLQSPGQRVVADNCSVKYIRNVNIPAEVEGKLIELNVEEGMNISEGDVLAVVDDTAAKLALELKRAEEKQAMLEADNNVNLEDARNSRELADAEAESHKKLYDEQAIPFWEMKKKVLEAVRAALRIDLAEMQKKIASAQYIAKRSEREIAQYEQQRRQVFAPFDGYVETRIAQRGEWVQPGSPIATLVQLDRVRVEGVVDALAFSGRVRAGLPVTVRVFASSDRERPVVVQGKLGFVSSELNLRRQVRIWIDIDNVKDENGAWIVKPGMQAEILFE
ncbi:efflux RND transporter periplasmic adaptor subunit [Aporhodopirellula aestuarii]|uniref:HlyD family efflux transporter periplasmic adaptor subunit n=1 Tax=Aporhodopirellula aestuarii TaxID=2950107 RepID=A0ABT0UD25_9BACT|nr:HlyD family efflux transporter periplasmic adaptor subunit [Aporhodopirellula aestuarii]MCM2374365.1 HlyD family efflux transporter periplasmic adaptor subunit [Aporhodopirellula aestuarii]